jgi:tRNA(fMet)-specific endonuclease VapC
MKQYLLDTNICVFYLRGKFNMSQKIKEAGAENCFISEITILELEYGIENAEPQYQTAQRLSFQKFIDFFEGRILPIRPCFSVFAQQKARLRRKGMPISDFDALIGSTALALGYTMVSENVREFQRLEGIDLENWVVR